MKREIDWDSPSGLLAFALWVPFMVIGWFLLTVFVHIPMLILSMIFGRK